MLRSDGLSIASFGQPAESAIALVTEAVRAQPTADDTVTEVMPQGYAGTVVRFVEFGQLLVILSDGGY